MPTSQTDCYRVVQPAAAADMLAAPPAQPQGADAVMQAAMQQLNIGPMDSQQGGVHEAPGSQVGYLIGRHCKADSVGRLKATVRLTQCICCFPLTQLRRACAPFPPFLPCSAP